ncbi:hypothetical protein OHB05_04525 [Streptomyces sp. NBC_00638]|uniref:hypothetical protein n=1 Tax=Streptomyces sp. NBC_00638 TaxID=2975794 RepID=UPI002256A72A|nr:hypothetical protein [Streptomyces sp. NBC_00638]MCX5001894.1 hypothetical protein [Streptomyces sp. NBC_00638]
MEPSAGLGPRLDSAHGWTGRTARRAQASCAPVARGSGLLTAGCGLRAAGCGLRAAGCGLRASKGQLDTDCVLRGVRAAGYGLPGRLAACLPGCLPACLPAWLPAWLPGWLPGCRAAVLPCCLVGFLEKA